MIRIHKKNKLGFGLFAGLLTAASLLTFAPSLQAQTATYASTRRQIKACVLTASNTSVRFVPYAFYELDSRADIKPGNWDIINPLASSTVSGAGYQRWMGNAYASTDGSFQQGAPLTKNMAPYWEVNLSTISDDDLRKMDIALLPLAENTGVNLTSAERERLRRFVDGGGTLLIESEIRGGGVINFFADLSVGRNGGPRPATTYHPLLQFPNAISGYDLAQIATGAVSLSISSAPYMSPIVGGSAINGGVGSDATISAGDYGAGHIIVSSAQMAANINTEITKAGKNLRSAPQYDSALKLLANMIAWTASAPTQGANSRHTNSTGERIGAQLGQKWTWTNPKAGNSFGSGAVMYKGLVFYVDSGGILHAFDRDPVSSLFAKSQEFINGAPYNEVMQSKQAIASNRVSTPTVASTATNDYVAVTDASGATTLYTFDIANGTFNSNGGFAGANVETIPSTVAIPSPVYSEGLFFAATTAPTNIGNGYWHIVAIDPATGDNVFGKGNTTALAPFVGPGPNNNIISTGVPRFTGPISVGYIHDSGGALDKVIYCPTEQPSANGNTAYSGLLGAMWFSTKNEPLDGSATSTTPVGQYQTFKPQGDRLHVPWYLGSNTSLLPVVHITYRNGSHATLKYPSGFNVYFNGAGGARETDVVLNTPVYSDEEVEADYTLNWTGDNLTDTNGAPVMMNLNDMKTIARLFLPAAPSLAVNGVQNQFTAQLVGGAAISSQDLTIFNTTFTASGFNTGRIYGLREQFGTATTATTNNAGITRVSKGTGTQIAWAFSPEPSPSTIPVQPSRFRNSDPNTNVGVGTYFTKFTPVGSTAIANDTVYVVGKTDSPKATIIMALRANPSMTITLGANTGIPQPLPIGWDVHIFNRTAQAGETDFFNQAPHLSRDAQFTLDPDSGNITIFDSKLSDGNVLNTGEPIVIAAKPLVVNGVQPPPVIVTLPSLSDPNYDGVGPLDNMVWFMAIPGSDNVQFTPSNLQGITPSSGPSVIGDTLYFATNSGAIASVDLRGSGPQHYLHINNTIVQGLPNSSDSNLRVHLLGQQYDKNGNGIAGLGPALEPPTGTERTLVLGQPNGLTALDARPTLIADGSRLLEVDYGGNALWSMDATVSYVTANGDSVTTRTNLARPGVAHRIGLDQFFFADTNNNRVTLADRGGTAEWELTTFNSDMGFLPPGFPLTLNAPTDVEFHQDTLKAPVTFASPNGNFTYNNDAVVNRYIIADSGNFRLLEIVDVLDATSGKPVTMVNPTTGKQATMLKQVSFVSKSLGEQNLKYRYRTIQEFPVVDKNGVVTDTYMVSAIANTARGSDGGATSLTASGGNQEGLGGSIEILHRNFTDVTQDGKVTAVFSSLGLPKYNGGNAVKDGKGNLVIASLIPLNNVTYCKGFFDRAADANAVSPLHQYAYQYMIADDNGCYVVNSAGAILWMLTSQQYFSMTGRPLRASSIQRLSQADLSPNFATDSRPWYPRFLITNRYDGPDAIPELNGRTNVTRGQIHGEVFEIRSLDYVLNGVYGGNLYQPSRTGALQFNLIGAITWLFPNERVTSYTPIRGPGAFNTLYTIERTVGNPDASTSTSLLQQPTYAERPN